MNYLLISDAAKRVQVESHVLRYWEEELKLPIKRNEAGHRYYTDADIERFLQIKFMKERGLQLKAIKMILKDGKLDVLPMNDVEEAPEEMKELRDDTQTEASASLAINVVSKEEVVAEEETREEKAQRLQWLLKQLIKETLQENNKELCKDIREGVVKELDYQFRCQEERETEREKQREQRNEAYYQKMDELLRKKSSRLRNEKPAKEKKTREKPVTENAATETLLTEALPREKKSKEKPLKESMKKETTKKGQAKVLPLNKKRHLFS